MSFLSLSLSLSFYSLARARIWAYCAHSFCNTPEWMRSARSRQCSQLELIPFMSRHAHFAVALRALTRIHYTVSKYESSFACMKFL